TVAEQGQTVATLSNTASVACTAAQLTPETIEGAAGHAFSGIVASFQDGNPYETAGEFTATIDWGDGTTTTGTIEASPERGYDVRGSHPYANLGEYPVTVAVAESGGDPVSATATAEVSILWAVEGQSFSGVLANIAAQPGGTIA